CFSVVAKGDKRMHGSGGGFDDAQNIQLGYQDATGRMRVADDGAHYGSLTMGHDIRGHPLLSAVSPIGHGGLALATQNSEMYLPDSRLLAAYQMAKLRKLKRAKAKVGRRA